MDAPRTTYSEKTIYHPHQAANQDLVDRCSRFVLEHVPRGGVGVELGCGEGDIAQPLRSRFTPWISTDISHERLSWGTQRQPGGLTPVVCDIFALPFADHSTEVVSAFYLLEHLTDIQGPLTEAIRILKPGGHLAIVGPNLLSPIFSILSIGDFIVGRHGPPFVGRRTGNRCPFGNTLLEAIRILIRNLIYLMLTFLSHEPRWFFRDPDLREPAHGDTDASFLCNPLVIRKFLINKGFEIVKYQGQGRTGWLGALAGGTWIIARKPGLSE